MGTLTGWLKPSPAEGWPISKKKEGKAESWSELMNDPDESHRDVLSCNFTVRESYHLLWGVQRKFALLQT